MKQGLLNAPVKFLLARMGHRDLLAVTDAGYNIPKEVETIDLALSPNIPTLMQVIDSVLEEIVVEKVILAQEIKESAPDILDAYRKRFANIEFEFLPHVPDFDNLVHEAKGAIRTGQYGKHAPNCILKVGCPY
jgi:D-ribose pyranase